MSSEIELTNSEMRQIEGSTMRMQNELSYLQMELYEVKASVHFQQEKYEAECILHHETKLELFSLQETLKLIQKQLQLQTAQTLTLSAQTDKLR